MLVADGWTSRAIAERLVIGERTVESHIDHIRAKLGVRSRGPDRRLGSRPWARVTA